LNYYTDHLSQVDEHLRAWKSGNLSAQKAIEEIQETIQIAENLSLREKARLFLIDNWTQSKRGAKEAVADIEEAMMVVMNPTLKPSEVRPYVEKALGKNMYSKYSKELDTLLKSNDEIKYLTLREDIFRIIGPEDRVFIDEKMQDVPMNFLKNDKNRARILSDRTELNGLEAEFHNALGNVFQVRNQEDLNKLNKFMRKHDDLFKDPYIRSMISKILDGTPNYAKYKKIQNALCTCLDDCPVK